ncbi:MAG: transglutaminase-like domain-containing protein [Phycisphaerae bacterium]|nr:transglutaminase-like domain-containing protein [Phycisphaerae bacterium]
MTLSPALLLAVSFAVVACHGGDSTGPAATAKSASTTPIDPHTVATENHLAFRLNYAFSIRNLPRRAKQARVWVPVPRNNQVQTASLVRLSAPSEGRETRDAIHSNRYLYFELPLPTANGANWQLAWDIQRRQVRGPTANPSPTHPYLQPARLIPTDGPIADLAREADLGKAAPLQQRMRNLYAFLLDRMSYGDHGDDWGRGDAAWACSSKYGNCTDYHSVFIGISRHWRIPAAFEMGFPLDYDKDEAEIPGYHCWAKFHDPKTGWWAVDLSEADRNPALTSYFYGNLHARRVHFTTGRDLVLVPAQSGPPLNYLIYPYVEIDGEPYDDISRRFSYRVLESVTE